MCYPAGQLDSPGNPVSNLHEAGDIKMLISQQPGLILVGDANIFRQSEL